MSGQSFSVAVVVPTAKCLLTPPTPTAPHPVRRDTQGLLYAKQALYHPFSPYVVVSLFNPGSDYIHRDPDL